MERAESAGAASSRSGGAPREPATPPDRVWPTIIAIALAVVMIVNGLFIWIAVRDADEVAPSYDSETR